LRESEKRESETERERTWRTRELEGEIQRLKKKIGPDLPWIDDGRRPVDGSTPVKLEVDSGEPKAGFLVVITDQSRRPDHDAGLVGGWGFLLQCLPIVPWLLCTGRQWDRWRSEKAREREREGVAFCLWDVNL
jgi:hypothetical protein